MKINYTEPDHKVNQGAPEGLSGVLLNVALIALTVFLFIFVLRYTISLAAPHIPFSVELKLRGIFSTFVSGYTLKDSAEVEDYLENLVGDVKRNFASEVPDVSATALCIKEENAFALPGAQIVITSGLINELDSEEELLFVLSHEVGHIVHRDNMKGLGEMLLQVGLAVVLGPFLPQETGSVFSNTNIWTSRSFTRAQEYKADDFGVMVLAKEVGSVAASLSVFDKFNKMEEKMGIRKGDLAQSLSATHPHSLDRSKRVKLGEFKNLLTEIQRNSASFSNFKQAVKEKCALQLAKD
ncbi:MAG: M48 family metallopeptidase [Deltaproteobacteria bacterium]|nr:M48 family metallopeptidase [Deltaproteobacteria bacterium]